MTSVRVVHSPTGETVHSFFQCPSGCPVYEVERLTHDGKPFQTQIIECSADQDALEQARDYARQWHTGVRLYRVPGINASAAPSSDLWTDIKFLAEIASPIFPPESPR
jgi:hypothetical protein